MAIVAFDTFTDTPGTDLVNHTPDSGGAWKANDTLNAGQAVISNEGRARANSSGLISLYHTTEPEDADYEVRAVLHVKSLTGIAGLTARASKSHATAVTVAYDASAGMWFLANLVDNIPTAIDTAVQSLTPGNDYLIRLVVKGTTAEAWVNGNKILQIAVTLTDPGVAGLSLQGGSDSTGLHLDDWSVVAYVPPETYARPVWTDADRVGSGERSATYDVAPIGSDAARAGAGSRTATGHTGSIAADVDRTGTGSRVATGYVLPLASDAARTSTGSRAATTYVRPIYTDADAVSGASSRTATTYIRPIITDAGRTGTGERAPENYAAPVTTEAGSVGIAARVAEAYARPIRADAVAIPHVEAGDLIVRAVTGPARAAVPVAAGPAVVTVSTGPGVAYRIGGPATGHRITGPAV